MTTKRISKKAEEPEFESLWVLFSFQTIFSKAGLTAIRNASQKRIDEALHPMHYQCESLRRDSKEAVVSIFEKWLVGSLVIVLLAFPVLLVLKYDLDKELSLPILMIPFTIAWGLLIVAQIYAWYRINKYFRRVVTLHLTQPQFRLESGVQQKSTKINQHAKLSPTTYFTVTREFYQKPIRGRNAKHCSLYTFDSFVNRFAMLNMLGLSFAYLGFFLKIYVFDADVTFIQMAPLSAGPLLLMYLYEMVSEVRKDSANWQEKEANFKQQITKHSLAETLKTHARTRCKLNCGLIPNFTVFAGYHGGFFALLCLRLDRTIDTSFFIILIPFWLFLIYCSIFLVISGLASTNQRVNKCERVALSVVVPIGFILSIVLGLCLVDGYAAFPVYVTFIPLVASLIFSYLYVRCLVKPSRPDFVKVNPELQTGAFQESQSRFNQVS